jgi:hypothetical protein
MKGLERAPDDRWKTISEMVHKLREARKKLRPASAKPKTPAIKPPKDTWFDNMPAQVDDDDD